MAEDTSVTRTYRTAIRVGEDFITIEETITLPVAASDDEIAAAVDTGLRIYRAQQRAIEQQALAIREQGPAASMRILDPDAPASEKQRSYLDALVQSLDWQPEQLAAHLREQGATYETLTKGQASAVIDELKAQVEGRREASAKPVADQPAPRAAGQAEDVPFEPASERQLNALANLGRTERIDIEGELRGRFGIRSLDELSASQAGQLLKDLQAASRRGRSDVMQERRR